jgi:transcriptional regulator with XRE-family HTH domain
MNTKGTLGSVIRDARLNRQITLRAFAKQIGVSPALETQIEKDRTVPSGEVIQRIAAALELDEDALCGLAGKLTASAQRIFSRVARSDPKFFRTMLDRIGGAR